MELEIQSEKFLERKIFGGTNFMIVLWTLISILRLVTKMETHPWETVTNPDLYMFIIYMFIIPLLFLTVLNVFMGITLFIPQKKNKMWLISIIIVTVTLVALNTFQLKIENMIGAQNSQGNTLEF